MAKAVSIISKALQKLGVLGAGETARGNDANDCLADLNTMIDSFPLDSYKSFTTQESVVTLPANSSTITIGPGQAIDIARPSVIPDGGFVRTGGIDYHFDMIGREQYAAIGDKDVVAHAPTKAYYDANGPAALLYFHPLPAGDVELHLPVERHLIKFPDLTTDVSLPSGYERFLIYALAHEVAAAFEREIPPTVARTYMSIMRSLKRTNFSVPIMQTLDTPGRFNIIGNTYN